MTDRPPNRRARCSRSRLVMRGRWLAAILGGLLSIVLLSGGPKVLAQSPLPPARTPAHEGPSVQIAAGSQGNPGTGGETQTCSIDLAVALRLAERKNPTIAIAREAVLQNLALQQEARWLLFPTLVAGGNLHIHRGTLQRDTGQILDVNSQSLYYGGGAGAVGSGTVGIPMVRILSPLSDALFEPLVARQRVVMSRFDARATSNTILLDVASRYLELAGAQASLDAYRRAEADITRVIASVDAFVRVGQARKADADRAHVRGLFVRSAILEAEQRVAVASARLAQLLDLDPSVRLQAVFGPLERVQLIDASYDLPALLDIALHGRPELKARAAAIAMNRARLGEEQMRPWLPVVSAGYSAGEFGGGSNLAPSRFDQFAPREDFEVWAVWTLENAGIGNLARQRTRRAEVDQAISQRIRIANQIQEEVSEAYGISAARLRQMDFARQQEATASSGFQEELTRTRGGEGLPIEALNSFELLVRARQDAISAVIEYDQAQFRLFVALGSPPSVALPQTNASASGTF